MSGPTDDLTGELARLFPDEVVTHAHVRDVALPGGAGTMALITLDNGHDHHRPNSFGPRGLAELDAALTAALGRDDVAAVGVTGKPFGFAAGADITGMPRITAREQALAIARRGHAVLRRFADGGKPSFCFLNGVTLGGGLELALHCSYRTISAGVPAVGFPEVSLGIVPGWGGTWLGSNLIGAAAACQLVVTNPLDRNRMLTGPQATRLGLADAMFEPADFLERSIEWAAGVLTGQVRVERPAVDRGPAWSQAVAAVRAGTQARLHGSAPAVPRALDLIDAARTASRDDGFAAEDAALADLLLTGECRASLYTFDLVQRRARRPVGPEAASATTAGAGGAGAAATAGTGAGHQARPVSRVGVVGAGLMAAQLALLFARRLLVPVVITDVDPTRVDHALDYVQLEVGRLVERGRATPDQAARIRGLVRGAPDKSGYADCDVVIEAVFEELTVKQQVFAELERVVAPECVLATNTSALSVSAMAAALAYPERVVGLHFFNPAAVLPLVEVVRAAHTDDATLATTLTVARNLRKTPVLVRDAPGFVVNRLLTVVMGEVMRAVDEGTPVEVADTALFPLGLPMTPFELLHLVGPAVALHVAETLHEAFPDRFAVSPLLRRLVEARRPGLWSVDDQGQPYLDEPTRALLPTGGAPLSADQVRGRALGALAREIRSLLDDGVVADVRDVDLAMVMGAGWPSHLGGITPYLDRAGIAERAAGGRFLPPGVASVAMPPAGAGEAPADSR